MSSADHTVIPGPSLLGFGNQLSFTPVHQMLFETGIGPADARMSRGGLERTDERLGRLPGQPRELLLDNQPFSWMA
jgi:hypothetical protein